MKHLLAPDKVEFEILYQQTILIQQKIFDKLNKFYTSLNTVLNRDEIEMEELIDEWSKREFFKALNLKVFHAVKSLVMIHFYKEKIKSDEGWMNDNSEEIFPNYDRSDYYVKDWFDYFSDNFFIQISSCFDIIGNLLNCFLRIRKEKPDFETVINCLNQKKIKILFGQRTSELFLEIKEAIEKEITGTQVYQQYKVIRNDAIHNLSPSFPFQNHCIKLKTRKF